MSRPCCGIDERLARTHRLPQGASYSTVKQRRRRPATAATEKQTQMLNLSAYAELLRSDVRTQKVAIITEVMGFTEAEDTAFWPIYREYDAEMSKLGDERVALIAEYAKNYAQMTDEVADKLATKALDLEARRQAVKAQVRRPGQESAVPEDGGALAAGRAPIAAAHRSADLGGASGRPSDGDSDESPTHSVDDRVAPADRGRVAVGRPRQTAIRQDRGRHFHRCRQQGRSYPPRRRPCLRDPDRRDGRGRILGAEAGDSVHTAAAEAGKPRPPPRLRRRRPSPCRPARCSTSA